MGSMFRLWGARAVLGAAAAGALLWAAGGTVAQDACATFSLIGAKKTLHMVDNGAAGDSAGDTRILTRDLTDDSGREFAVAYFVSTMVDANDDGGARFTSNVHIVFRDGEMSGATSYVRPNDETAITTPISVIVHGGTGIYAGAAGTIDVSADDPPVYQFNITCD